MTDFDTRQLRNTLGSYATGVTVVTALDPDGKPRAMTANSFSSVSLDPPLVLWSIGNDSTGFDVFTKCKSFAIHILKQDQEELSGRFASREARTFDDIAMEHGIGGIPLFGDYLARFQCEIHQCVPAGDHVIIIGKVLDMEQKEGAPLVFQGGKYRQILA